MEQGPVLIGHSQVLDAVSPAAAIEHVKMAFVRHSRGEWSMPPKVYLQAPPNGDFRAMPASGDGLAIVKWVTSFPANRAKGLPVVVGTIVASDATDGRLRALIDGTAVTALRTGASAAVAASTLSRPGASSAAIVGCGLHGRWAGLCLREAGFAEGVCFDLDPDAAATLADELGWKPGSLEVALACDVVTTVTPGHDPVIRPRDLHPGLHVNALGADGPGKAELEVDAVLRCRLFCDEWAQASHGGELTGAVEAGKVARSDVTEIGAVLDGRARGRVSDDDVTLFDSTGLAIQDLAIVHALMRALDEGRVQAEPVGL